MSKNVKTAATAASAKANPQTNADVPVKAVSKTAQDVKKKDEDEAQAARGETEAAELARGETESVESVSDASAMAGEFSFADVAAQTESSAVAAGGMASSEGDAYLAGQDAGDNTIAYIAGGAVLVGGATALILTGKDDDDVDAPEVPVNRAPTFASGSTQAVTTSEDEAEVITVSATDPDGDDITYTVTTDPTNGTIVAGASGTFTYTPNADFNGSDSFVVTAKDENGATATQTINITVTPVEDPSAEQITVNAGGTNVDEDTVDTTYNVELGNYTYTIEGLDAGDSIVSPEGVPSSLINSSFTDGQVTIEYAQGGQVANIVLTGLTAEQDAQLFGTSDLNTVFGAGTFA